MAAAGDASFRLAVDRVLTRLYRSAEVVPIYEKWVADYPNFADAHVMLAGAHENLGRTALRSHAADAAMHAGRSQFL